MITRYAEFTVYDDKLPTCLSAIEAYVKAVATHEPRTLKYESYRIGTSTRFIHFMQFEDEDAEAYHRETEHGRRFVDKLYPLCLDKPNVMLLSPIR